MADARMRRKTLVIQEGIRILIDFGVPVLEIRNDWEQQGQGEDWISVAQGKAEVLQVLEELRRFTEANSEL
jgi:hypothetical protein